MCGSYWLWIKAQVLIRHSFQGVVVLVYDIGVAIGVSWSVRL
jgi:hypothetical protein